MQLISIFARSTALEIARKLVWILGLLIIVLASQRLLGFLEDIIDGLLPAEMAFSMLGSKMLSLLPKLMPVALMLAVLLEFARMQRDRELAVLRTAGLGLAWQIRAISPFMLLYIGLVAAMSLAWGPMAESRFADLKERGRAEVGISTLKAARFWTFGQEGKVAYVRELDSERQGMQRVFLHSNEAASFSILTAAEASFDINNVSGNRYIKFRNGYRYSGKPGMRDYRTVRYDEYGITMQLDTPGKSAKKTSAVSTGELWRMRGDPYHDAELHFRLAMPIATFLLAVMAIMLSQLIPAESRLYLFSMAILNYLIYSNLIAIGVKLLERGKLPAALGLWWVHVLMGLAMLGLYWFIWMRHWSRYRVEQSGAQGDISE
ncbi:MAG: LPS export ABC transporter permease LptF [Candidatus Eutrophobiaceae bacterium]